MEKPSAPQQPPAPLPASHPHPGGRHRCLTSILPMALSTPGRQHRPPRVKTPLGAVTRMLVPRDIGYSNDLQGEDVHRVFQSIKCPSLRPKSSETDQPGKQVPPSAGMYGCPAASNSHCHADACCLPCTPKHTKEALRLRCLLSACGTQAQDSLADPLRQSRCPCPAVPQQPH